MTQSLTLSEAIQQYGRDAYLLSVGDNGPHTSSVLVDLSGDVINCAVGQSAVRNMSSQPHVSLFWPPGEAGGYAMIVNGITTEIRQSDSGAIATITLTKSVLHRPGPKAEGAEGPCASDCRQIRRS